MTDCKIEDSCSRLVISTVDCTKKILERYIEDLCLPAYLNTEIIRKENLLGTA